MKFAIRILLICSCLFSLAFAREDNNTYMNITSSSAVWANPKEIKVYIEESSKSSIFERAFKTWDDALRSDINFTFANNSNEADITIGYIEQAIKKQMGITKIKYKNIQGKKYIDKAHISVAKKDLGGFIQCDASLMKLSLHEIGHALGVTEHSKIAKDIMYHPVTFVLHADLSYKDIYTVNKLYGF